MSDAGWKTVAVFTQEQQRVLPKGLGVEIPKQNGFMHQQVGRPLNVVPR